MPKATEKKREISIVERRLKSGSIFAAGSRAIPLKEPTRWTLREVNTQINDNHLWETQAEKGWAYATADDLAIAPHEVGFRDQDGRLVKGQHGHLVLMKMEIPDFTAIQQRKDLENRKQTFGQKAVRDSILSAAASQPGGAEGAEFLARNLESVQVTDSRERVSLEDE